MNAKEYDLLMLEITLYILYLHILYGINGVCFGH